MPTKKSRRTTHRHHHPRCNFQFADGRRCRMLRHPHLELCLFHNRELLQLQSAQEIGAELLALGGNFRNPIALNFVLGKLFGHVATGRMHRRQATALAYIAQLLLQTLDTKRYNQGRDWYDYSVTQTEEEPAPKPEAYDPLEAQASTDDQPGSPVPPDDSKSDTTHNSKYPSAPPTFLHATTNAHQPPEHPARL